MMKQSAVESPQRVFGAMLAYYRTRAGMTPEQLGARVFVSGSQIRKIEAGTRTPTEDLAVGRGLKIVELPIHFADRNEGESKMSLKVQMESALMPFVLRSSRR
jgi:ribosome-binding protein aMBF1 (putative translation factor)